MNYLKKQEKAFIANEIFFFTICSILYLNGISDGDYQYSQWNGFASFWLYWRMTTGFILELLILATLKKSVGMLAFNASINSADRDNRKSHNLMWIKRFIATIYFFIIILIFCSILWQFAFLQNIFPSFIFLFLIVAITVHVNFIKIKKQSWTDFRSGTTLV